jgi:hypothetical protein
MIGLNDPFRDYDSWRLAGPPEPRYGIEEYDLYLDQHPDCGWDPDDMSHYELFVEMMELRDSERQGEIAAEAERRQRESDDLSYWNAL